MMNKYVMTIFMLISAIMSILFAALFLFLVYWIHKMWF